MKLAVLATIVSSATAFMAPSLQSSRTRSSLLRETVEEEEISTFQGSEAISSLTSGVSTVFTSEDIAKTLPHRYPFALVDKVVEYEEGKVRFDDTEAVKSETRAHNVEIPVWKHIEMKTKYLHVSNYFSSACGRNQASHYK